MFIVPLMRDLIDEKPFLQKCSAMAQTDTYNVYYPASEDIIRRLYAMLDHCQNLADSAIMTFQITSFHRMTSYSNFQVDVPI